LAVTYTYKYLQKNVYSVFRYQPLSIGFAQLSSTAVAQNGIDALAPTPTIGSAAATISATSTPGQSSAATAKAVVSFLSTAATLLVVLTVTLVSTSVL